MSSPDRAFRPMQASVTVLNPVDGEVLEVDLYPVGLQYHLWVGCRMMSRGEVRLGLSQIFAELHRIATLVRAGNRRTARQHLFGTYAEPREFPFYLKEVGRGWTKRRAIRDLQRRLTRSYARW